MTHPSASRWARLPLATGAALLLTLAVPASAWPQDTDVFLGVIDHTGHRSHSGITNLQSGKCYTIHELSSAQPAHFYQANNRSPRFISLDNTESCTGQPVRHVEPRAQAVVDFTAFKIG